MNKEAKYIKKTFKFYLIMFYILGLYIILTMGIESDNLNKHPLNPRNMENLAKRGNIYTRSGEILAGSKKEKDTWKRFYPMGEDCEPLIGYWSRKFGTGGLENSLNNYLAAKFMGDTLFDKITRHKPNGEDIYLTIDGDLQKKASQLLQGKKGAIVVLNPQNGEILALASSPAFDPNKIDNNFKKLTKQQDAPFLLRPVNGVYPPGSVFKLFTYAACLEEGLVNPDDYFACNGDFPMNYPLGIYHIREAGGAAHGNVSAVDALVHSCNIGFAQMGLKVGVHNFVKYGEKFGLTESPDFILQRKNQNFPKESELSDTLLAQSAFGQGEITISPLEIALMVSAFANGGKIYQPQIVKSRINEKGKLVYKIKPAVWKNPISVSTANYVRQAMIEVVERGTGWRARIDGIKVAGKTGSAENPFGDTHAWFACFAPADSPKVLVVVTIENGGGGGVAAAPIGKNLILEALKKGKNYRE